MTPTNIKDDLFGAGCPDYDFEVMMDIQPEEDWYKIAFLRKPGYDGLESIGYALPPGNWQFLFTSNSITEEEAKGIFGLTVEQVHSLLQSKGLKGNVAILKLTTKQ